MRKHARSSRTGARWDPAAPARRLKASRPVRPAGSSRSLTPRGRAAKAHSRSRRCSSPTALDARRVLASSGSGSEVNRCSLSSAVAQIFGAVDASASTPSAACCPRRPRLPPLGCGLAFGRQSDRATEHRSDRGSDRPSCGGPMPARGQRSTGSAPAFPQDRALAFTRRARPAACASDLERPPLRAVAAPRAAARIHARRCA
jgi:hypothetical protein